MSPEELDAIAEAQGVKIESGDIVLVHTGWWGESRGPATVNRGCRPQLALRRMAACP